VSLDYEPEQMEKLLAKAALRIEESLGAAMTCAASPPGCMYNADIDRGKCARHAATPLF